MKTVAATFHDDFDDKSLPYELELLPIIFAKSNQINFADVVEGIQSLVK